MHYRTDIWLMCGVWYIVMENSKIFIHANVNVKGASVVLNGAACRWSGTRINPMKEYNNAPPQITHVGKPVTNHTCDGKTLFLST